MALTRVSLSRREKNEWSTVALAEDYPCLLQNGNCRRNGVRRIEQNKEYVVSYIRQQLLSLDIHPAESGRNHAGALSHLKTEFSFYFER